MNLNDLTIKKAHQGLKEKKFSSVELTKAYLGNIAKLDGKLGAFLTVTEKAALEQAEIVDEKIGAGLEIDVLAGIPSSIKDAIVTKGVKTTASSKILENYIPPYDASVIGKLKAEDFVMLGKNNCDEFAMGASTETSAYKKTYNPWNLDKVPGGSSGGSATAVAAGEALYSLGSDTGGSVRQPAGFCGIVGLKPTYGRVSRYGLIALASSFDQIGPLTRTVEDAGIVLETIGGVDPKDSTSVKKEFSLAQAKLDAGIKGMKVGVPKEYFIDGMDKEVEKSVKEAIQKLEQLGAEIKEVSLPHTEFGLAVYYLVLPSEASANLARFDGIRYGFSTVLPALTKGGQRGVRGKDISAQDLTQPSPYQGEGQSLLDIYLDSRGQGFGDEVRRRIMLGTYALSAGYYDQYYVKAQQVRRLIRQDFDNVFKEVDVIATPTSPTTAFNIGEKFDDPLAMYLSDVFTVTANVAGIPGISVPCGFVQDLPVGLQLLGPWWDEATILRAAHTYEQATDWHNRTPKIIERN